MSSQFSTRAFCSRCAAPVAVHLGEVTEADARLRVPTPAEPRDAGADVTEGDLVALPVDGGEWASLALTVPAANQAAGD